MSGARITIDALWRCLCPSIDAATLTRAVSAPYRPRLPSNQDHCAAVAAAPLRSTGRLLHSTTTRRLGQSSTTPEGAKQTNTREPPGSAENLPHHDHESPLAPLPDLEQVIEHLPPSEREAFEDLVQLWTKPPAAASSSSPPRPPSSPIPEPATDHTSTTPLGRPPVSAGNVQQILKKSLPFKAPSGVTNEEILEALRYTRNLQKPRWKIFTTKLAEHLLANGVPPNTFLYETLLMAHASTDGSADKVRSLLEEMRQKKIPWSSTAYHSALRALAIHPDYLIRADVLRQMKERWVEVNAAGHQHIALGLLRDEQYELALEKLQEMVDQGESVEPWVFDIFIYVFGKLEFFDDALRIARHRLDTGHDIPVNIWYFLLDVCSRGQSYDATTYVWARTVPQGILNPSDGVCLNVLNMAASCGDAELATEVIQFLANRGTKLGSAHYEAVADAYCVQDNIEKAIEAFCIMHAARVETTNASLGSLSQLLSRDPSKIDTAILAMTKIRETHPISIIVFNAVLNELAKSDEPTAEDAYAKAMGLYHRVRELVPEGPNQDTYRHLLWRCTNPDLAQFLAGEMVWFGVRQNQRIMELMFQVQVLYDGPVHRAKRYFYKIAPHYRKDTITPTTPRTWQRFMDLSVKLVRRLIGERDPEAWRILEYCQMNGLAEDQIKALREEVEGGNFAMEEKEDEGESEEERDQDNRRGDDHQNGVRWELNTPEKEGEGNGRPPKAW